MRFEEHAAYGVDVAELAGASVGRDTVKPCALVEVTGAQVSEVHSGVDVDGKRAQDVQRAAHGGQVRGVSGYGGVEGHFGGQGDVVHRVRRCVSRQVERLFGRGQGAAGERAENEEETETEI